jgi:hypothetical protein
MRRSLTGILGRRRVFVALFASLLALAAAGVATAVTGVPWSGPGSPIASPVSTVDPAVASQFSVLTRSGTPADALPAGDAVTLQNAFGYAGPDTGGARRVAASNGERAFLVPANGGACVINASAAFCSAADHLAGADSVSLCGPTLASGQMRVEWLMPDGATNVALGMADGTQAAFPSGSNVYIASLPLNGPRPASIQWDAAGTHHSIDTGVPPGAQTEPCVHPSDLPPASQLPHTTPGVVTDTTSSGTTAP